MDDFGRWTSSSNWRRRRILALQFIGFIFFVLVASTFGATPGSGPRKSSVFSLFNLKEKSKFWSESVLRGDFDDLEASSPGKAGVINYTEAGSIANYMKLNEVDSIYLPVPVNFIFIGFEGKGNQDFKLGIEELGRWFINLDHVFEHTRVPHIGETLSPFYKVVIDKAEHHHLPIISHINYNDPLFVDKHYQAKALPDMVIVVQSEQSSWESYLQCNGKSLLWDLRRPVKAALAATAEHLAGLLPLHLVYSHAHETAIEISTVAGELRFTDAMRLLASLEDASKGFANSVNTTIAHLHPIQCTVERKVDVEFDMTTIPAFLVVIGILWFVLRPRRSKPKIN